MLISQSKLVEKKSKFFAYLYKVLDEQDVRVIIDALRKDHKKATHICYASILGADETFKNDGEVGSPGKVLLELLKGNDCDAHLLVVVRYYGGVKLGPGGVARAFRTAARQCFNS